MNTEGAVSLKVLAERKVEGVNKQTTFRLDPRIIEVEEGFNARPINPDHVESFKVSIRAGAVIPAVDVRVEDGHIIMVDGHHRLQAYMELIAEGVEILAIDAVQFRGNNAERVAHLVTTAQGLQLTPLQRGIQYKLLRGWGWSAAQIAARVGRKVPHVHECLTLAGADTDVQDMLNAKEVPAAVAVKAVRKHGPKAGKVLKAKIKDAAIPITPEEKACAEAAFIEMREVILRHGLSFATGHSECATMLRAIATYIKAGK